MDIKNNMFKHLQIQTRTGCNLKCPMCPLSKMTQPQKLLSEEILNKILDELNSLNYTGRISLYLMNEPFLDERLSELIKLTRHKLPNATITISTNGVIPTPDDIAKLSGLSYCNVSCYTQAIYDKWKDKGVNAINMIDYKYPYNNRGGNVDVNANKVARGYCERPFTQMYVNAFGQAILCCSDYKFEVVMGDLHKNTMIEIWEGEKYKKYRSVLQANTRKGLILCETCNY